MIRLALALALLTTAAEARTIRIHDNPGGVFQDYQARVQRHTDRGDRIIIDGRCDSACVMLLAVPGACVTRRARLGLHGAATDGRLDLLMSYAYAAYLPEPMATRYLAEWRFIGPGAPVFQLNAKTAVRLGAKLCGE